MKICFEGIDPDVMKRSLRWLAAIVATACLLPPLIVAEEKEPRRSILKELKSTLGKLSELQTQLEEVQSSNLSDEEKAAASAILEGEIQGKKRASQEQMKRFQNLVNKEKGLIPPPAEPAPDPNDPSELYFQGWLLSRDAGKLEENDKPAAALEKLELARQLFDRVARDFPVWKQEMVKGRRAQTAESLARLTKQVSAPGQK